MIDGVLDIRECREPDLDLLERCMPTGGHRAHARHFARQRAGTATYLIAWQARGNGVGSALIGAAARRVAARGSAVLAVSVGIDNPRAAALYDRLGHQPAGLQGTARYAYPDHEGVDHEVVEQNVTLAKRLVEP